MAIEQLTVPVQTSVSKVNHNQAWLFLLWQPGHDSTLRVTILQMSMGYGNA
jgi:hypothetical protein